MYERFTDRARKVMQLANQEAQRFNHEYIGTEHVLLGLVKEGSGVAANALKNLDIDLVKIRLEIDKIVPSGQQTAAGFKLPQAQGAKRVIQYAIEESRLLGHNYVGTEHLLLGLLREREGVAARVLSNLGLKAEEIREEVLTLLGPALPEEPITARVASEYDLYLPLHYADGSAVEPEKVDRAKKRLTDQFGGLVCFPQRGAENWTIGNVTFREELAILRVLAEDARRARTFFRQFKEELKTDLGQDDILILAREVIIL